MRPTPHTIPSPPGLSAESEWYVSFDMIEIGERIGGGQFGDVHTGVMTTKEGPKEVAVKSCKMAETQEDKMKFVREAGRLQLQAHGLLLRHLPQWYISSQHVSSMFLQPHPQL